MESRHCSRCVNQLSARAHARCCIGRRFSGFDLMCVRWRWALEDLWWCRWSTAPNIPSLAAALEKRVLPADTPRLSTRWRYAGNHREMMMVSMCVYKVCHEIVERTKAHLATLPEGNNIVSSSPLVMKVEYAYCPDLTLLDTPGMVLITHSHAWLFDTLWAGQVLKGDQPGTAGEIKQMVLASLCVSC